MNELCVLTFAGHMIDSPVRSNPRFPASTEPDVQSSIRKKIVDLSPVVAISSAACGGDIIFAEEALEQKIPLYIILPFEDKEDFIKRSVLYAGEQWKNRFWEIYNQAQHTYFVKSGSFEGDKDFEDNQHAIIFFGLGFARAREMQLICLILYDSTQPGDGIGGTESFFSLCEGLNIPYEKLDMAAIREKHFGNY